MENKQNKINAKENYFKEIAYYIEKFMIDNISRLEVNRNGIVVYTVPRKLAKLAVFLRDDLNCSMDILSSITCVDYPFKEERFEICYFLFSSKLNHRIILKTTTDGKKIIKTLSDVYSAASWYEREVWDMFGISFAEHVDMRRIYNDFGFKGYPLRKDFPNQGYVKLAYDNKNEKFLLIENQIKNQNSSILEDEFGDICRKLVEKNCGLMDF